MSSVPIYTPARQPVDTSDARFRSTPQHLSPSALSYHTDSARPRSAGRNRTPVRTMSNNVMLSSSLTAPTAAFSSAVAERKRQQRSTGGLPTPPADAPHGKTPFLYTSMSSHQRQAKFDTMKLEEAIKERRESVSPPRSPRSPRDGDRRESTKEAAEMALRQIDSGKRYDASDNNSAQQTKSRRDSRVEFESRVHSESRRRGHGYKSVFDRMEDAKGENVHPRLAPTSVPSPNRQGSSLRRPMEQNASPRSQSSSSDEPMEVIEVTPRGHSSHNGSYASMKRGSGPSSGSWRGQQQQPRPVESAKGPSSMVYADDIIDTQSEIVPSEVGGYHSPNRAASFVAASVKDQRRVDSRPLSPVRSSANLKSVASGLASSPLGGAASPLRGGLITPNSSIDSDIMLTAAHLKNINRQELVEQLTQYASAYVNERDAHDATRSRLREAEGLADTSTSMAEDSERMCAHLRDNISQLTQALLRVEDQLHTVRADHDELLEEHGALRLKHAAQEKRNIDLQTKVETLEEAIKPIASECEALKLAAEKHTRDLSFAESKRETALEIQQSKHDAEKEHLEGALHRAQDEIKRLQDTSLDVERSHQHTCRDYQRQIESLEADAAKSYNTIETLRSEIRDAAHHGDRERQAHVKQEEVLEREIETLKARCSALSTQYEQASDRRNELEREMVALREGHMAMQAKVRASLATLETNDSEKERVRLLERQNGEMEKQIQELRKTLNQYLRR